MEKTANIQLTENQIDLIQNIMKDSDIPARTPDYRLLQSLRKKFWKVRKEVFGEVSKK
jgi:hypothetical protein